MLLWEWKWKWRQGGQVMFGLGFPREVERDGGNGGEKRGVGPGLQMAEGWVLYNNSQSTKQMNSNKGTQAKRKYSRISLKKRQLLVSLVVNEGFTIARAARRVAIRASTARMIINKYKETGTYPIKNFKNPVKSGRIISPGDTPSVKNQEGSSSSQSSSCEAKASESAPEEVPREEAVVRQLLPPALFTNYGPMYYYPFSPYFA